MHQIVRSIKRILPADLPVVRELGGMERPASATELLNMGIVPLGNDLYSCCEQLRSDDDLAAETGERTWEPHGEPVPGEVLATGDVKERHAKLPADVRGQVMRAVVMRAKDTTTTAQAIVETNILEQMAAVVEFVGDVVLPGGETAPLVDFEQPSAFADEARRLAALPVSVLERVSCTMAECEGTTADVITESSIVPHRWAGERG